MLAIEITLAEELLNFDNVVIEYGLNKLVVVGFGELKNDLEGKLYAVAMLEL